MMMMMMMMVMGCVQHSYVTVTHAFLKFKLTVVFNNNKKKKKNYDVPIVMNRESENTADVVSLDFIM